MAKHFNPVTFGAKGDGLSDDSEAFSAALSAIREAGGGVLTLKRGLWRTGPIELFSHTTLYLERGAVLSFIPEPARYTPVYTRWEGVECYAMQPLLFARGAQEVTLAGEGTLDGNGLSWWNAYREKRRLKQTEPQSREELELARLNRGFEKHPGGGGGRRLQFLRPPLAQFYKCTHCTIEGITLTNSPFWTLHPVFCEDITIRRVSIFNPKDSPNTDGIDIDSCRRVLVEDCHVSVGDDGIAIKSGADEDGRRAGIPSENITVRNCLVEAAHGGLVIGSETAGGVSRALAENCRFTGTDRGIRIKTRRGRGGKISGLEFRGLEMEKNLCPLAINMYYRCGADTITDMDAVFSQDPQPVNKTTPSIKDIVVQDCRATGCRASAGFVAGLPESPVENLLIKDCAFSVAEDDSASPSESDMFLGIPAVQEKSMRFLNVRQLRMENVRVEGAKDPFLYR
ncbi:MAG: glycoside hydrolase family 28 protein [Treponema sp.]|jgi:polygalacturonase|nr:glycoside hydrolase family 28 protein [Treponema sp.]